MKRGRLTCLLLTAVLLATACGRQADAERDVRAAINRTESEPRGIAYEEALADGGTTRVDLLVTDDYRYKAQVSVDGEPALDVVVRDDALAVRVIDVEAAARAVGEAFAAASGGGSTNPGGITGVPSIDGMDVPSVVEGAEEDSGEAEGGGADAGAAPPTPEVIQALETRNWVVDPTGAPELFSATAGRVLEEGEGGIIAPVLEALRGMQRVENAIQQSIAITRFNKENIAYDPRVETFPIPERGSPVVRYDLFAPPLPNPNQSIGGGTENLPSDQNFRRMSIYVEDERVVNVLESIEINPRLLRDIEGRFNIPLPSDEVQAAAIAVETLNTQRLAAGLDPIVIREIGLELIDVSGTEEVVLPAEAATGNLKGLVQVQTREASSEAR